MLLPPVTMRVFYEDRCTIHRINEKKNALMQKLNQSLEGQCNVNIRNTWLVRCSYSDFKDPLT